MITLGLALLCATAWLQAQDPYPQNPPTGSSQKDAASQTSVEGCLQGSNGNFTLTDNTGTTYQLQGDTSKLSKHVGHEVQITGSPSDSSAATASSGAPQGSSAAQTLTVDKMKHISETCKAASK